MSISSPSPNDRSGGNGLGPVVWQLWFGFFVSSTAFCAVGYWLVPRQNGHILAEVEKFLWLVIPVALGLAEFLARQLLQRPAQAAGQAGLFRYMVSFACAELVSIAGVAIGIWAGSAQPVFFFGGASLLVFLRLALVIR